MDWVARMDELAARGDMEDMMGERKYYGEYRVRATGRVTYFTGYTLGEVLALLRDVSLTGVAVEVAS